MSFLKLRNVFTCVLCGGNKVCKKICLAGLFCLLSCKTIPYESYIITDTMKPKEILLENDTGKNVFKLNVEIKGEIKGKAYILIAESKDKPNIRVDLENKISKTVNIDWYSDQCLINYVPVEIEDFDPSRIIIRYSFYVF